MLGIIFTYFLVIYDQVDEKGDLAKLKADLKDKILLVQHQVDTIAKMLNSTLLGRSGTVS